MTATPRRGRPTASDKTPARKTTARKTAAKPTAGSTTKSAAKSEAKSDSTSVGANVRREREKAGISVRELARRLGVSASFLSQFELGQSQAAVNTLFAIATELNLSLDDLLGHSVDNGAQPGGPAKPPERADMAHFLSFQTGVRWRRLADLGQEHVDFLMTEYEPGADSAPGDSPQQHKGNDYGYVLEGTLTVIVNGRRKRVKAGNAVAMRGDVPHRLVNDTDELVRAIWFVTD